MRTDFTAVLLQVALQQTQILADLEGATAIPDGLAISCNLLISNSFATLFYIQRKMPALPVFQARQMEISLAQEPRSSGHKALFDRMCPAIKVNFSSC